MRLGLIIAFLLLAARSFAEVSVSATLDRNRTTVGEAVQLSLIITDSDAAPEGSLPAVSGLEFAGAGEQTVVNNGKYTHVLQFHVTPAKSGKFTIPAVELKLAGKPYSTKPLELVVEQNTSAFARIEMPKGPVYLGQTIPIDLCVYATEDLHARGLRGYDVHADNLSYKISDQRRESRMLEGKRYDVLVLPGSISPTQVGRFNFGPGSISAVLSYIRQYGQGGFSFRTEETRDMPVTFDAIPVEVVPLPTEGRPADFGGAVGQWKIEVTAKPTEVTVGDPITLTVKISGNGNIETVPPLQLKGLDGFKTYDPTTKTSNTEVKTTGERIFQQVLVAKDATVTNLPEIRLSYFDPVAKAYKTAVQPSIPLKITAGAGGPIAVLTGSPRARAAEKLGEDLVYLKGDQGEAPGPALAGTPVFWTLNLVPVFGLAGALAWKRRRDRLAGDIAYARRSRAARNAQRILNEAGDYEHIQRALQEYLGDRLNIPSSGMTASVVEEHLQPRGLSVALASEVRKIFEACDAARFSGKAADTGSWQQAVKQLIDELEKTNL